ncbi:MAG TPA: DUF2007 domain-containing protein [Bacteroidales bacterium]|jgi:hypothetical protein|nr:DUF2007 domain-containing protein [Bacteroidales bacterium]HPB88967.1 DUF2007 domain-containing protein [Bacteroidales bacterium]HPY21927.1 DUF2007 domain-containing protein [Bacteroidales bacterium]HQA93302.1 DUF2007 domain-containing protein [Bacteroidales bacterium]HQN23876.1 DUF2007 domain-containing protein [Bacteroidales bacterium]
MKEVARYTEPYLAHIAKGLLESEGINAFVLNENSSLPGICNMYDGAIKLVVSDEDYDLALKVLAADSSSE